MRWLQHCVLEVQEVWSTARPKLVPGYQDRYAELSLGSEYHASMTAPCAPDIWAPGMGGPRDGPHP